MNIYTVENFEPNYKNLENAARNMTSDRMPLYEHLVNDPFMVSVLNKPVGELMSGDDADLNEAMTRFHGYYKLLGFDTTSHESCMSTVLPGNGALGAHKPGSIHCMDDFKKYPWDDVKPLYFQRFDRSIKAMGNTLPEGMKAIGGVGNGVFECVQDVVGYTNLCYIKYDDPELYAMLFERMGQLMYDIWDEFLKRYDDYFCAYRFGDDLGYKSGTLLPPQDVIEHIVPVYKKVIGKIHESGKPFLLHSCGNILEVMDEIIDAGVDAKHSNEDVIAPFSQWVDDYGDRIGNFGGIDCDVLVRESEDTVRKISREIISYSVGHGGFAFGTGNSVPEYIPVDNYLAMNEAARMMRGE